MSRWITFCATASLCLMLSLQARAGGQTCNRAFLVGWEPWPPYQYVDATGHLTGLDIELVQAVMGALSCEVRFQQLPWKRQLLHIQKGLLDLAPGASRTSEREAYGRFSVPLRDEQVVLLARKDSLWNGRIHSLADTLSQPVRLVGTIGYYYGPEFENLLERRSLGTRLLLVSTDQIGYQMLLNGRADVMLVDPVSAAASLAVLGEAHRMRILGEVYRSPIHALFSQRSVSEQFVQRFDQAVEKLERDGTLPAIRARYMLTAPQAPLPATR
ncbi:MAG: hypothetical protein D6758_05290 [Gammaproteobacteria bacterium]|nr:MAG: hypothetical protein D6758_05290 [Gammaproteobacteria bacterium]